MMLQNYHIWQYHASFLGEIYPKMPGFRPKIIFFGRNLPQNAEISPAETPPVIPFILLKNSPRAFEGCCIVKLTIHHYQLRNVIIERFLMKGRTFAAKTLAFAAIFHLFEYQADGLSLALDCEI